MIKTFKVQAEYNDLMYVVLQVDTDQLTLAMAVKVNTFFENEGENFVDNSEIRIDSEDGDEVKAVVRMCGAHVIRAVIQSGGAVFHQNRDAGRGYGLTQKMHAPDGTPFCEIGISVIEARVEIPDFDSVELLDITALYA